MIVKSAKQITYSPRAHRIILHPGQHVHEVNGCLLSTGATDLPFKARAPEILNYIQSMTSNNNLFVKLAILQIIKTTKEDIAQHRKRLCHFKATKEGSKHRINGGDDCGMAERRVCGD